MRDGKHLVTLRSPSPAQVEAFMLSVSSVPEYDARIAALSTMLATPASAEDVRTACSALVDAAAVLRTAPGIHRLLVMARNVAVAAGVLRASRPFGVSDLATLAMRRSVVNRDVTLLQAMCHQLISPTPSSGCGTAAASGPADLTTLVSCCEPSGEVMLHLRRLLRVYPAERPISIWRADIARLRGEAGEAARWFARGGSLVAAAEAAIDRAAEVAESAAANFTAVLDFYAEPRPAEVTPDTYVRAVADFLSATRGALTALRGRTRQPVVGAGAPAASAASKAWVGDAANSGSGARPGAPPAAPRLRPLLSSAAHPATAVTTATTAGPASERGTDAGSASGVTVRALVARLSGATRPTALAANTRGGGGGTMSRDDKSTTASITSRAADAAVVAEATETGMALDGR